MTYARDKRGGGSRASTPLLQDSYDVLLPRRSLQVQSGVVRYSFSHAIANDNLLDPRRVSITFRQNAHYGRSF